MKNILAQIVEKIRRHEGATWEEWELAGSPPPPLTYKPISLHHTLKKTFTLIAECKHASPVKGILRDPYDPSALALMYKKGGAHAISVVTEQHFFKGRLEHLRSVRTALARLARQNTPPPPSPAQTTPQNTPATMTATNLNNTPTPPLPLLRKDFIVHRFQIREAYCYQADLFLLIKALLPIKELKELLLYGLELGLTPLIELFNATEASAVVKLIESLAIANKVILGINNRNLKTFTVDLEQTTTTSHVIRTTLGNRTPVISESGIRTPQDLTKLKNAGCNGALIGESFVREKHPDKVIAHFLSHS